MAKLKRDVDGTQLQSHLPLPSLAIVHPNLLWLVVIQRLGDGEAMLLKNQDDTPFDSHRSMWGSEEQDVEETQLMGLCAVEGDTWELLVAPMWTLGYIFDVAVDSPVATTVYYISYVQKKKMTNYLWKS
ncbi:hypothetical protein EDD85DRAFT_797554 [Armillaria nabsnona]|nr:hypothetical protein EDD85DRAFT_797554 [Armillaria nabsnona]